MPRARTPTHTDTHRRGRPHACNSHFDVTSTSRPGEPLIAREQNTSQSGSRGRKPSCVTAVCVECRHKPFQIYKTQ